MVRGRGGGITACQQTVDVGGVERVGTKEEGAGRPKKVGGERWTEAAQLLCD